MRQDKISKNKGIQQQQSNRSKYCPPKYFYFGKADGQAIEIDGFYKNGGKKNRDSRNCSKRDIKIGDKIAAVTLAEKLLPDTMVIHVEKANPDIPGLYQVINQEFLLHEAAGCSFVNREQDLGIPGLRTSKMSYNPVRFVKKYTVMERTY